MTASVTCVIALMAAHIPAALAQTSKLTATATLTNCGVGPITKVWGEVPWLVYSCDNERSIVIIAAPGSPAEPWVFTLDRGKNGIHLDGDGASGKQGTAATYAELSKFSQHDFEKLIEETKSR
jgi:hypothetical protein